MKNTLKDIAKTHKTTQKQVLLNTLELAYGRLNFLINPENRNIKYLGSSEEFLCSADKTALNLLKLFIKKYKKDLKSRR